MRLPRFVPSTQQLAASRPGRVVLTFALGMAARQLVTQARNLVAMVDALDGRNLTDELEDIRSAVDRAAVLDGEPPTPAPEGDPLPDSTHDGAEASPVAAGDG